MIFECVYSFKIIDYPAEFKKIFVVSYNYLTSMIFRIILWNIKVELLYLCLSDGDEINPMM